MMYCARAKSIFNLVVYFVFLYYFPINCEDGAVVTVQQGQVRGTINETLSGRVFYSFRGIPYAQPPVGDLRFQAPLPANNWDGIFNATQDSDFCIQLFGGVEDCLALNVYTPKLPDNTSDAIPVLVFIHGGAFSMGQASSYVSGPEYFMENDVILVTIYYRLGPFGFLSTGDAAASGNFGFLDQTLALKWVRDNIASFSGDYERVLLFGESSGAASTAYHILSPASTGLFRGAITESGSALNPWAIQPDPLPWAIALGNEFQCNIENTTMLVNCLREQSATDLVKAAFKLGDYDVMIVPFRPVVENPEYGKFITEQPIDILQSGNFNKVPIISGVNKDEGDSTYGQTQQYFTNIDDAFYQETMPVLLLSLTNYKSNLLNVSYAVKSEYFDKIDVKNTSQVARTAIDFYSDCSMKSANDLFVRSMAGNNLPVYMYTFEYAGTYSRHNYSGEIEIAHGDELYYIFYVGLPLNSKDRQISDTLINMWTNFATNLNPNPTGDATWIPTSADSIQYLRIQDELSMQDGYLTDRMDFWNNVVPAIVYG